MNPFEETHEVQAGEEGAVERLASGYPSITAGNMQLDSGRGTFQELGENKVSRETAEPRTMDAEKKAREHGKPTRGPDLAGGKPLSSSSRPRVNPELLERWAKARADDPDPEPWRILMEKEHKDKKVSDVYVKLPVEHVMQVLDKARSGSAGGGRPEYVMVPAKITSSIATSTREVFKVATISKEAEFVNEPAPHLKFSKEELAQIYRELRNSTTEQESKKGDAEMEQDESSGNATDSQYAMKMEDISQDSAVVLRSSSPQIQDDMASLVVQQPDAKRVKMTTLAGNSDSEKGNEEVVKKPEFNILQAIFSYAELTLELSSHLGVEELTSLYAISKDFHQTLNFHLTTALVSHAKARIPEAAVTFPFRCYRRLCVKDPAGRPHPVAERAAKGELRPAPSIRWLKMIYFRDMVCHEIRDLMGKAGIRLPEYCEAVMKKIWFLMDIPDNDRRTSIIQNRKLWKDIDLFFATMLFIRMDMRFNNPLTGSGKDGMRRLLLSQRSLSMFWKALNRTAFTNTMDITEAYIRLSYTPRANEQGRTLFGVPPDEIGKLQYEGWGALGNTVKLQRPDDLVLKESIRRDLGLEQRYMEMMLWGFNPKEEPDTTGRWAKYLSQ